MSLKLFRTFFLLGGIAGVEGSEEGIYEVADEDSGRSPTLLLRLPPESEEGGRESPLLLNVTME